MSRAALQRGAAAIEFALVLLFLIPLAFGITELGRAFYQYNTLVKATRDGARWLAQGGAASVETARMLAVYGNPAGTGEPLLEGLVPGMVACSTGEPVSYAGGSMTVATVSITGFKFVSLVPGVIDDITFGPISATMRQG